MNKFLKVCLGIGLSLFIIGVFIASVSFGFGARVYVQNYVPDISEYFPNHWRNQELVEEISLTTVQEYEEGNYSGNMVDTFGSISGIDVELIRGQLHIEVQDNGRDVVEVVADNIFEPIECYVDNDMLYIRYKDNNREYDVPSIAVYIPSDMDIEDVKLNVGAGEMSVTGLTADMLDVIVNAGSFNASNLDIENTTKIDVAAGNANIESAETGSLQATSDAGELIWHGSIDESSKIINNTGSVYLYLVENDEDDFNYKIDCNMGSINMRSFNINGISTKKTIDNDASDTLELSCNMGSIVVEFQ